jgi:hypothetical protein
MMIRAMKKIPLFFPFLILLVACGPSPEQRATQTAIAATATAAAWTPTPSLTPTRTPTPTPEPTSTPTPTEVIVPSIPGLTPTAVTMNLESNGFSCDPMEQEEQYLVRHCSMVGADYILAVNIYGRDESSVDLVSASVFQWRDSLDMEWAASFLGYVATIPYTGAVPEEARTWVEATAPMIASEDDEKETVFSDVTYRLFGPSNFVTLEIGQLH